MMTRGMPADPDAPGGPRTASSGRRPQVRPRRQGLWRETAARARPGGDTGEDAENIQALIPASLEDLHAMAVEAAMNELSEDEAWRDVIDGLADAEEARDKLEELNQLGRDGTVDARREQRISRAIVAWITWKFPKAADQESAA
jgi:hypothetical protein